MNEEIEKAQKTLLELSDLALNYLVDNFNYKTKDYPKLKQEIGNLTDQIRNALNQAEENENFLKIMFTNLYWARWFRWVQECKTCEEYNSIFVENAPTRLTQAEFDLIKKVVEKYGQEEKTRVEK